MKISCLFLLSLGFCLAASAAKLPCDRPEYWKKNSSGTMKIERDDAENAVRFQVEFKPGTDYWAYPELKLPSGGIPADAKYLVFEAKMTQQDPGAGYSRVYVMFGYKGGNISWTPSTEWQQVVIDLDARKVDLSQMKALRIGAHPKSPGLTFSIRNVEFHFAPPSPNLRQTGKLLRSTAPAMLFTDNVPLRFTVTEKLPGASYKVLDCYDREVAAGEVPESGSFELPKLPRGYYRIVLSAPGERFRGVRSFSVIPDRGNRRPAPESPYGMDVAINISLGNIPGQDWEKSRSFFLELIRLSGMSCVRDRIHHDALEPVPGKFGRGNIGFVTEKLSSMGIGICATTHRFAKWALPDRESKLPKDLLTIYRTAKESAAAFRGEVSAWEFWNEPELPGFCTDPAWEFAAASKAAYLGFKAGDSAVPVTNASFCVTPPKTDLFAQELLRNDLGEYFDIFNFHVYGSLKTYSENVEEWKRILRQHGILDIPFWVTENGTRMEGDATEESGVGSNRAHSHIQEMIHAEFVVKAQILLQSLGVARDFTFVLPPYNEQGGLKDWGVLRRDFSAKPAFAAFATLTDQLGDAQYLGQLDCGSGIRAFLFQHPDKMQTVAFWSKSELDLADEMNGFIPTGEYRHAFSLPGGEPATLTNVFGTPEPVVPHDGRFALTATRFPAYFKGKFNLTAGSPAPSTGQAGALQSGLEKTVVLRVIPEADLKVSASRTTLLLPSGTESRKMKLQAINFGDRPCRGRLTVEGAAVSGLPKELELAPLTPREFEITLPDHLPPTRNDIVFGGVFDGKPISRLVLPVLPLDSAAAIPFPGTDRPEKWRKNSSGTLTITWDDKEQAIRFDVEFPPGVDRWVYPEFLLENALSDDTIGLFFEIKTMPTGRKPPKSLVMFVAGKEKEKGVSTNISYAPSLGEWQNNFIELTSLDLEKIKQFRIGMNPAQDKITFWLRNIRLLKEPVEAGKRETN